MNKITKKFFLAYYIIVVIIGVVFIMLVTKIGIQYNNLQTKNVNKKNAASNTNGITLSNQTNKVSFNGFKEWWEETRAYWNASSVSGFEDGIDGVSYSCSSDDGPIKSLYDGWYDEYKALKARGSLTGESARRFGALAAKLAKKGGYKL